MPRLPAVLSILFGLSLFSAAAPASQQGFDQWVRDFRSQARSAGISASIYDSAFAGAKFQPTVVKLDRKQPEFSRPIWQYLDFAVSDTRVRNGQARLQQHLATAQALEDEYGVPKEIFTAIWGVESNYGDNFGDFRTIDALATLGFDGRRASFAKGELIAALKILQSGDIPADRMRGSWAGAMGHTQFIPSSFLAYAVDADGDGRRDIWGSVPDALGSTANYLARAGWRRGEPWGVEVKLPANFDYGDAELDEQESIEEWMDMGVRTIDGKALPQLSSASVIAPAGARGPAFLVGKNFRVIMRYNNSTSYALAVSTLGDRIAGKPGIQGQWPRTEPKVTYEEIREVQRLLNEKGFDTGGQPDGLVGPNTRNAIRAYQRSVGLKPDGFPSAELIRKLKN